MAVYKPTYCYPYLEPVDFKIPDGPKYFTCQVDTSNIGISGYKAKLLNENNEVVFPTDGEDGRISPISELGIPGALNGEELRFPFIQSWNNKTTSSYNAIYCKIDYYINYYQEEGLKEATNSYKIKNGAVVEADGVPLFIDNYPVYVGETFVAGGVLYEASTQGLQEPTLVGGIYYVVGGETFQGKSYKYQDSSFGSFDEALWVDINEKPVNIKNDGKTYKWQVTLFSGERGKKVIGDDKKYVDYSGLANPEFNTFLGSGTILGSTEDRIQGPISDKIYAKQWLQLLDSKGNQVGTRTRIESYSQSVGHIYPVSGDSRGFTNSMLYRDVNSPESLATQFAVYKYSNNIDQITSQNKVNQSVNFPLLENGALYNASGAQPYDYIISGSENIDKFNRACGTNPQLCSTDKDGNPLYKGETVLIWNPKGSKQNPLTGLFTIGYTPSSSQEGDKSIAGIFPSVKETVDTFFSTPDGEYGASTTANLTVTVGGGECYIEGKKIENTEVVIEESTDALSRTIRRTAQKSGTQIILTTRVTQVWNSNPGSATLVAPGKSVTITVKNGGVATEATFTFSMLYDWRKISSYIGKVFFVENGEFSNTNILSKAVAGGSNDIVDGGSPTTIEFAAEEPIEIYPESENKFYGKIFKNEVTNQKYNTKDELISADGLVYVSPFVGLQAGARLYVSDGTIIRALTVDSDTWAVTYSAMSPAATEAYSSVNPLKYEIRTNFRSGDETPFYAYDTPQIVPWAENALSVIDVNTGSTILLEKDNEVLTVPVFSETEVRTRFVVMSGQYVQPQGVSWTSYQWYLVDGYGNIIQDTGKKYDGRISTTFYGLDGPTPPDVANGIAVPNTYYAVLVVEDELGNSLTLAIKLSVEINPQTLPVGFSGEFDCRSHAVVLKIQDYGYPKFSQTIGSTNVVSVLAAGNGVNYQIDKNKPKESKVAITGTGGSLKAADQVIIPEAGAQLKHFFAKGTESTTVSRKLATNAEGNIEWHTKIKLDANFCGEILNYSVDIGDSLGNVDKLNILLELPNNFNPQPNNDELNGERNKVKCIVSTKDSSASASGIALFDLPSENQEAYYLQPEDWIKPDSGDLTTNGNSNLEYLDFAHPFVKQVNGHVVSYVERKDYTNINEPINTKAERKIGECCLQTGRGSYFNKWTDLKRIQVETPAGYRVVQTADPAKWQDTGKDVNGKEVPMIWAEGWNEAADTNMVQVKRHAAVGSKTWLIDCYMQDIDELYNRGFNLIFSNNKWVLQARDPSYQLKDYVIILFKEEVSQ